MQKTIEELKIELKRKFKDIVKEIKNDCRLGFFNRAHKKIMQMDRLESYLVAFLLSNVLNNKDCRFLQETFISKWEE